MAIGKELLDQLRVGHEAQDPFANDRLLISVRRGLALSQNMTVLIAAEKGPGFGVNPTSWTTGS